MNNLTKKDMARSDWQRILKKDFTYKTVANDDFCGAIGLIRIEEIREPLVVCFENKELRIVDVGYHWLQFAPKEQNYWLTAMLDEYLNVIQYYFDITDGNFIENDAAWFYDLYLDVVLMPNGKILLLDEDELKEAWEKGIISRAQYDLANQTAYWLMEEIRGKEQEYARFCKKYLKLLEKEY